MKEPYKHADIIGPFTEPDWSYASINGYKIPHVKLRPLKDQNDGRTEIHLERGGQCWIIDNHEIDVVLHLLATAMAVAAGYTCHGEFSEMANPFKVQMISLGQHDKEKKV